MDKSLYTKSSREISKISFSLIRVSRLGFTCLSKMALIVLILIPVFLEKSARDLEFFTKNSKLEFVKIGFIISLLLKFYLFSFSLDKSL